MEENTEYKPFALLEQYDPEEPGFYNTVRTLSATKNDCSAGTIGSTVTLTANANQFLSTLSVVDANEQADAWLSANAQAYANNIGIGTLILVASKSVIFENQDSDWSNCRQASSADYMYTTNKVIGAGREGVSASYTYYLNRYRGIIDTTVITTKPKSAKIKFKFSTNNVGTNLTINLFASSTQFPINQSFQLSDWNDWDSNSFVNSVVVLSNSISDNEISLNSTQLDLLYSEQAYNFFIISNGDKNNSEPTTNNRPELSILQSTGEVYLECKF